MVDVNAVVGLEPDAVVVDHTDNCYGYAEEPGGKGSDPVEGTVLRGVQNLVAVNGLQDVDRQG